MQLVCTVLQCEAAMLTLLESSQVIRCTFHAMSCATCMSCKYCDLRSSCQHASQSMTL